jgi:hypothetical protein
MTHSDANRSIAALCAAALLEASTAMADDFDCPPSRGEEIVDGNVIVVGTCSLFGTLVKGNVLLEDNGNLLAEDATIVGSVQTDGAEQVRLLRTVVNGNVQLTGIDGPGISEILDSKIGGTLDIETNPSTFELKRNRVNSDLKANGNTGGVAIRDNDIGGNLQCQNNAPAPTGGDNVVDGNKEDQCENLAPAGTTTTTLPFSEICGDHNSDGSVGATDALVVLYRAVGRDVELLCPAGIP